MSEPTRPPKMYQRFVEQYPKLGQAWDLIADQGADGPLDVGHRTFERRGFRDAAAGFRLGAGLSTSLEISGPRE